MIHARCVLADPSISQALLDQQESSRAVTRPPAGKDRGGENVVVATSVARAAAARSEKPGPGAVAPRTPAREAEPARTRKSVYSA